MSYISPTIVHKAAPPHKLGKHLMETMQQEHHAAMVEDVYGAKRPSFLAAYWEAFCQSHPVAAEAIGYGLWYAAVVGAAAALFGAMVVVRL